MKVKKITYVFKDISIKNKLICAFVFLILLPYVTLATFYVNYTGKVLKDRIVSAHKEMTVQIGQNVNVILNDMEKTCMLVIANNDVVDIISTNIYENPETYFSKANMLNNFFTYLQYSSLRYPNSFSAIKDSYGNMHSLQGVNYDTRVQEKMKSIMDSNINSSDVFEEKWLGVMKNELKGQDVAPYLISMIKKIPYTNSAGSDGMIMVSIDEGNFYKIIKPKDIDPRIKIMILDETNTILSSTDRKDITHKYEKYSDIKFQNDDTAFEDSSKNKEVVHEYKLLNNKWKIVQIIPYNLIYKDINIKLGILVLIGVGFLLLFILCSVLILGRITRPIINLTKVMNRVKSGDLSARAISNGNDEIGQLSETFNEMIIKINELIAEMNFKEKEKRDAELKMLRSQIKPHFLFNTLNSIRWVAEINRARPVSELIVALSSLLKNSILNDKEFVTLDEEIENLKNYCKIQEARYGGIFEVNYNIDASVEKCKVINLLLQPILENSLIHGFSGMTRKGIINIDAFMIDDCLEISVQDNGKGVENEKIEGILNGKGKQQGGIGISNVNERLKINYGEDYGLKMYGEIQEGVTTVIKIPIEFSEEGHSSYDKSLHC